MSGVELIKFMLICVTVSTWGTYFFFVYLHVETKSVEENKRLDQLYRTLFWLAITFTVTTGYHLWHGNLC